MSDLLFFDVRPQPLPQNDKVCEVGVVTEAGDFVSLMCAPNREFAESVSTTLETVMRAFERCLNAPAAQVLAESLSQQATQLGNAAVEAGVQLGRAALRVPGNDD